MDKKNGLQELAWQYREIKKRIQKAAKDGPEIGDFWAIFAEWEQVRGKIKAIEEPDLESLPNAYIRNVYKSIKGGFDPFVTYTTRLAAEVARLGLENPEMEVVEDIGPDYFIKMLDLYTLRDSYLEKQKQVGALIVNKALPTDVKELFSYLKDLYCYGFNAAAVLFCRSLVESMLVRRLEEKGHFKSEGNEIRLDEIKEKRNSILTTARNRAIINDGQRDRAIDYIFRPATDILNEGRIEIATDTSALDAIVETMALIQELA